MNLAIDIFATFKLQVKPHNIVDVEDGGGAEQGAELDEEHQHDDVQDGEQVKPLMGKKC